MSLCSYVRLIMHANLTHIKKEKTHKWTKLIDKEKFTKIKTQNANNTFKTNKQIIKKIKKYDLYCYEAEE